MAHESLKALRLAVVGTGALGSALLHLLAECGVRDMLLIDPDRVQTRNLATSAFLREAFEAEGASKSGLAPFKAALLGREALRQFGLPWSTVCAEVADTGWERLSNRDVLVCCTDSALSRVETAWAARVLRKPLIEAGVFGGGIPECRVSWFPEAPEAACYLCGMSEERRAQVLAYAASASLGCASLEDAPAMTGSLLTVERAAVQMVETLRAFVSGGLPGERSEARRLRLEGSVWMSAALALGRSATCPWHGASHGELLPLPWDIPLRESLSAARWKHPVLHLAWQVCTLARCGVCGARCEPFLRLAFVRRTLVCGSCGTRGRMDPLGSVGTVRKQDSLAMRSPRQLGQPESHLYLLRRPVFFGGSAATMEQVTE